MRERLLLFALTVLVFFSRVPFLDAGYGNDPDAWQMVNVAHQWAHTGEYAASRLPGYPLPEFAYSVLSLMGLAKPIVFNGATAFLSSVGFLLFGLVLKLCGWKDYILGSLALSFTPVIFINSTNSMDYIWALTFILASTFFLLVDKPLIGAAFLGLAVGSRLASVAMLMPLSLLIIRQYKGNYPKVLVGFGLLTFMLGALFYTPVFLRYGPGFLPTCSNYPSPLWILYSASIVVWGAVGSVALTLLIVTQLNPFKSSFIKTFRSLSSNREKRLLVAACMLAIALYLIVFLMLPYEGAYLIPIVPFVILLVYEFCPRKSFMLLCIAIILSSFLLTVEKNKITLAGPIFNDHQERLEKTDYVKRYLSAANSLDHKALIIAGPWLPQITAMMPGERNQSAEVEYVWLIGKPGLQSYLERGYQIYYLSAQRELTLEYHSFDPEELGARPLIPGDPQKVKW